MTSQKTAAKETNGVMDARGKFGEHGRNARVGKELDKAVETLAYLERIGSCSCRRETLGFALLPFGQLTYSSFNLEFRNCRIFPTFF